MEQQKDITQLLNVMNCPAFFVKCGKITHCNQEAQRHGLAVGDSVNKLLKTGVQEYADFQGGCLNLTINLSGIACCVSVSRWEDWDIFVLDQDPQHAQLQAMALAAQELRGPLSNIMSVADNLFPIAENSQDPDANKLAARINRGLFQMLRIVSNMSDAYQYSKESHPQMELRDIRAIGEEFFQSSAKSLESLGIHLQYNGLKEPVYCLLDSEKLERAANNLLSNAVKFSKKGSTITVTLNRRGTLLYLTIQDDGEGIAENLRGSVYTRFLRQPGIEDGRFGIGLGMVMVRSVAAMHGGTVLIEQLPTQGTRVTMTMQIHQDTGNMVRSPAFHVDYAGERDHQLIELSESLPTELYGK